MKKHLSLRTAISVSLFALLAAPAAAHYLWVAIDAKTGEHGTTNIFFEEGPAPGDGQYLDPFVERGTFWIRTAGDEKPVELSMSEVNKDGKRWLSAALEKSAPRSVDAYAKWGVYRYGNMDVLLHYYARYLDVKNHEDLHALARAPQQKLDIVAHEGNGEWELKVLWQGKAAANRPLLIRGPKGFQKNLTTDEKGRVTFQAEAAGRYLFRTNVEVDEGGTEGDKAFQQIRHHATLGLHLPLAE